MDTRDLLVRLRQEIPFLQQIPDAIYLQLQPGEFVFPTGELKHVREEMEQVLLHYVMTYKAKPGAFYRCTTVCKHLCGNLTCADLSSKQKALLKTYEDAWMPRGVSFCIYQKPIIYRNVCIWKQKELR